MVHAARALQALCVLHTAHLSHCFCDSSWSRQMHTCSSTLCTALSSSPLCCSPQQCHASLQQPHAGHSITLAEAIAAQPPGVYIVCCCVVLYACAGTLIGCAPNNFMAANAGDHLSDLDSLADLYNPRMLLLGLTVGFVALLPVYMKHRHERSMALLAQKIR